MHTETGFAVGKYRFSFKALDNLLLPDYSGSSWRGIFGHQLKKSVCVTHEKQCKNCLLWRNCVYTYLFETPPAADAKMMKKYPAVPHPYIIQPDPQQSCRVNKGESLFIDISLVATANQYLPYIIHAFKQAGKKGIGRQRGTFYLESVAQFQQNKYLTIYQHPQGKLNAQTVATLSPPALPKNNIILNFITPYRVRSQNKYITPKRFSLYHLVSPLLRRLSSLHYFHNHTDLALDYSYLSKYAKTIYPIQQQLRWKDWQRYSSRQEKLIKMGGLIGSIELSPESVQNIWEYLYIGQFINIGKGTVMGLGHYTLTEKKC